MKKCCLPPLLILWFATLLSGADLIRILPVTDNILQLHFDEGHLDYQGMGEDRYSGIRSYYRLLDIKKAMALSSYSLTSPDDPSYRSPRHPVALGRKSKGAEFNNLYDENEPKYLSDHFIYLELPSPMVSGNTYTVQVGELADNLNAFTFVFDEQKLRSETVHVNQHGFSPKARKYAYLSHWMGDFDNGKHTAGGLQLEAYAALKFHLIDQSTGAVVFSGPINKRKDKTRRESAIDEYGPNGNYTNADVWQCDFSAFSKPGEYVVSVERIGCSYTFEIREDIYREAYAVASHALFCQRAGIEKEVEPGWVFERDYHPDNGRQKFYYDASFVTSKHKIDGFRFEQEVDGIWGWYHDAGDWDHYPHHVRVPATLLHLYDMRAEYFRDGDVSNRYKNDPETDWINEGENGLPDLLDEAGWLVCFLRRARHALMDQGLGTGGVPGYVGREGGFESLPSWMDTRDVAVTGENPASTFDYAGLAARYARCLQRFRGIGGAVRSETIAGWIAEAKQAYAWAEQHGGDEASRSYAAAALYLATEEKAWQDTFREVYEAVNMPGWYGASMREFANLLYAVIPAGHPGLDEAFQKQVRRDLTVEFTPSLIDYSEKERGYRWSSPAQKQANILGSFSAPRTLWAATAHHFTGEQKYLGAVRSAADYFLGGNEMNMVWMTGFGEHSEPYVFHLNSWYSRDYNSRADISAIHSLFSTVQPRSAYIQSVFLGLFPQTSAPLPRFIARDKPKISMKRAITYPKGKHPAEATPPGQARIDKKCRLRYGSDTNVRARSIIYLFLLCLALPLSGKAQEAPGHKNRALHIAAGLLHFAERDEAYSSLLYSGALPSVMIGYGVEGAKKSEQVWAGLSAGNVENRFGARAGITTAGIFNYTLYHAEQEPSRGFHLGWSNNNLLSIRDFEDAANFSPRFDYHTSFGPAARYRYTFAGAFSGLSLEAVGHFQLIGFFLQSGYVSDAPDGTLGGNGSGFGELLRSASLFYPGKAWNWGLWPSLHYTLRSGTTLGFAYRYDMAILEGAHRSSSSRGYYLLTLTAKL